VYNLNDTSATISHDQQLVGVTSDSDARNGSTPAGVLVSN